MSRRSEAAASLVQHPQTVAPRNSVAQISKLGNRTLRYLEAAIDFDSLELAADHFGTTKAALAKAIRQLEADLGIDLLARDREQVRPTEAGARALEYAAHSRRGLAELLGAIENLRTGAGGVLRIGATIDWVRDVLPGALIELRAQGRRYEAEVTILENNRLHALLSDRVIDLFFGPVSAEECGPDTRFETFAVDWNDVYAGRSNPVHETTVADLSACTNTRGSSPVPRPTCAGASSGSSPGPDCRHRNRPSRATRFH